MRALVVCPGRGSYGRDALGYLSRREGRAREVLQLCDAHRQRAGRPTATDLDASPTFRGALHVAGENASILTLACTLADHADLPLSLEVVGVVGNSMGFYTALGVSGALPLEDTIRLVDTMGSYQARNVLGGQVLTPLIGPDWRRDPARLAHLESVLAEATAAGHGAWWSIDLGSYAVLGADAGGLAFLEEHLPAERRGDRQFPTRLPLHSAFHTPLLEPTSRRALAELADLRFRPPSVPLIDGRGHVFRPLWTSPAELRDYTLGHQVVEPFDYRRALQVGLRHTGAEVVVLLGPGNSLGGPSAAILVEEGWRGLRSRADLEAADPSPLVSWSLPEHRARLGCA